MPIICRPFARIWHTCAPARRDGSSYQTGAIGAKGSPSFHGALATHWGILEVPQQLGMSNSEFQPWLGPGATTGVFWILGLPPLLA
jgi:hypothetical protein